MSGRAIGRRRRSGATSVRVTQRKVSICTGVLILNVEEDREEKSEHGVHQECTNVAMTAQVVARICADSVVCGKLVLAEEDQAPHGTEGELGDTE